ncbi:MAG: endonuclease/exonuclease/phosphatase family protein, partial [Thermodesulfobacteriota bacterium]|nr:endonuclease/exonuclease/phosphatase family protein [Thermodesulfobacteriota bacterium]
MKRKLRKIPILSFLCVFVGILILVAPLSSAFAADPKIKVMTRNLYLGADIFEVVLAAQNPDPALGGLDVPIAVANVFQTMQYTNFPARAEALADEIARYKPQVIGLQEVETYYIQSPGDFVRGGTTPAEDLVIDFYTVLDAALKARGMEYEAFINENANVEMPMLTGFIPIPDPPYFMPTFDDVRMVDHDVILVRKGHDAWNLLANNYTYNVGMDLGGAYIEFTRGYLAVDVDIKGEVYRFVNTHLEVRSAPESDFRIIQALQMNELLTVLGSETKPIIMVGDFNSSSDDVPFIHPLYGPIVPPYMQATMYAGYLDSWLLQDKYDEG